MEIFCIFHGNFIIPDDARGRERYPMALELS